jgi:hypothetical protein
LFTWNSSARGHGISARISDSLSEIEVGFSHKSTGSFQRLIDCYSVLGIPTIFSQWLPFPKNQPPEYQKNDLQHALSSECKYRLTDLLTFRVTDFENEIGQKYGKLQYKSFNDHLRSINEELLGYVIVFVASNIARYRPAMWRKVIDAQDDLSFRMHESTINSYSLYVRGAPVGQAGLCNSSENFLNDVKGIFELAQDEYWLTNHFKGSFVMNP